MCNLLTLSSFCPTYWAEVQDTMENDDVHHHCSECQRHHTASASGTFPVVSFQTQVCCFKTKWQAMKGVKHPKDQTYKSGTVRLIWPKIELHTQALGKAFWLALERAPYNLVITTSLSTFSPQNTKLNEMNMSQGLWVKDVAVRTLTTWHLVVREMGQATAFNHPEVPAPKATPAAQQLSTGQQERQQAHLLGQIQQQEGKWGFRFSVWIFRHTPSEEYNPDLHLLYLSVLLERRLWILLSTWSSSFSKPFNIIWSSSMYFYCYLLP